VLAFQSTRVGWHAGSNALDARRSAGVTRLWHAAPQAHGRLVFPANFGRSKHVGALRTLMASPGQTTSACGRL